MKKEKKENKKFACHIVSLLLSAALVFSVSSSAFAINGITTNTESQGFADSIQYDIEQIDQGQIEAPTDDTEEFEEALPPDIQGPVRHIAGCVLSRICNCLPSCSKKFLLNSTFLFKLILKTAGKAISYAGGAEILSKFVNDDYQMFLLGSAVALAVLETGSNIVNYLLQIDHNMHPEAIQAEEDLLVT